MIMSRFLAGLLDKTPERLIVAVTVPPELDRFIYRMNSSIRDQSAYRILTWIALTFCIFGIYYLVFIKNSISIPFGDSVNYWAAGKLMLNGNNPYLSENVLELRYLAGNFTDFPPNAIFQIMYPPWAMPFMLPLGLFDYPISSLFWLIFHIIIYQLL